VYRSTRIPAGLTAAVLTPTLEFPLAHTLEEPQFWGAVVVYKATTDRLLGDPITRIELLSPANLPNGSHHAQYLANRSLALESGMKLIEIHYLHAHRPTRHIIPSYVDRDDNAYPYFILVNDPTPSVDRLSYFGFAVDEPIKSIPVPLLGADIVNLDVNAAYHQTFSDNRAYGLAMVDYANLPIQFKKYTDADQDKIRARMAAVQATGAPSLDSETEDMS